MAKYVIEIGLDANAAPRFDGTYSHLISLIQLKEWSDTEGTAAWFTAFQPGDWITFRACDYTGRPSGKEVPEIEMGGLFAYFLDSQNPRQLSPCLDDGLICSGEFLYPRKDSQSLVIPDKPAWRFLGPDLDGAERYFKFNGGYHRAFLRVSIAATVTVGSVKELRWFTHDPEIIVGVGGDGYKPPRRRPSSPRRR